MSEQEDKSMVSYYWTIFCFVSKSYCSKPQPLFNFNNLTFANLTLSSLVYLIIHSISSKLNLAFHYLNKDSAFIGAFSSISGDYTYFKSILTWGSDFSMMPFIKNKILWYWLAYVIYLFMIVYWFWF